MLLSAALTLALTAPSVPAQDGAPVVEFVQRSPGVTLLLEAHGGQDAVEGFEGLRLELERFSYPEPTEAEPEPAPEPGETVGLSVRYAGEGERSVRMGQKAGDSDLVRIAGSRSAKVWIDGSERPSADLAGEARALGGQVFLVLDLVLGALNGQVVTEPSGRRTRNGISYVTMQATFPANRGIPSIYLLYVNPQTGLVDRADIFDHESLRREATVEFSAYHESDSVRIPGEVLFMDRDRVKKARWVVGPPALNPAWPEGHFLRP